MKNNFFIPAIIFVVAVGLITAYMFMVQNGYAVSRLVDTDYSEVFQGLVANRFRSTTGLVVYGPSSLTIPELIVTNGNVGIGTVDPKVSLDVNGPIRVGQFSTKPACDANTKGSLVFDTANDKPYVCAASSVWKPLDSDNDKDGLIASFDINDGIAELATTINSSRILSGYTAYGYSGGSNGSWSRITGTYTSPSCPICPVCSPPKVLRNYCFYNTSSSGELPLVSSATIYTYGCANSSLAPTGIVGVQSSAGWSFNAGSNGDYHECGHTYFSGLNCTGSIVGVQPNFCALIDRDNGTGGANCNGTPISGSLPTGWDVH